MLLQKDIFRKCQIVLAVALGTSPVAAILLAYLIPEFLGFAWLFPGMYMILSVIGILLPGKVRLIYGCTVMLMAVAGVLLLFQAVLLRTVLLGIVLFYGIALLLSMKIASWGREKELPVDVIGFCAALHFVAQFLILMDDANREVLNRVSPWMTSAVFAFAGLMLLSINRKSMVSAGGKRPVISISMRIKNILLTVGLFAVSAVFSLMPSVITGSITVAEWLIKLFKMLSDLFRSDVDLPPITEETTIPTETVGGVLEPVGQGNEQFAEIVFTCVLIIGSAIAIVLVIWQLKKLIRTLKKYLPRLWALLLRNAANASEDYYEDEITDTREDVTLERTKREKTDLRKVILGELNLAPGERIRYRYRRMAKKHPQWRRASTARENLPEEAASLYERARYSDHLITEDEAQRFKASTRQI